jgi:hypothetical protein
MVFKKEKWLKEVFLPESEDRAEGITEFYNHLLEEEKRRKEHSKYFSGPSTTSGFKQFKEENLEDEKRNALSDLRQITDQEEMLQFLLPVALDSLKKKYRASLKVPKDDQVKKKAPPKKPEHDQSEDAKPKKVRKPASHQ